VVAEQLESFHHDWIDPTAITAQSSMLPGVVLGELLAQDDSERGCPLWDHVHFPS